MAIVETRYAVPGWGVGSLWISDGVVRAHDFHFETVQTVSDTSAVDRVAMSLNVLSAVAMANPRRPAQLRGVGCGHVGTDPAQLAIDRDRCLTPSDLVRRLRALLAGEAVDLDDVVLDLEWATPFQRSLIEALRAVRRGEVVSYGELAALAGRPRAPRAAGAVCAANRFAFIVPCHRVVAAHGIGGYGTTGIDVKRRLLALEGVEL